MPTIELRDTAPIGVPPSRLTLRTILAALPTAPADTRWTALHWWAVGNDDTFDALQLENATETGLLLSAEQLQDLARQLFQLIDGTVAQIQGDPPAADDPDLRRTCPIVIQAFDSSSWRVYARDPASLRTLRGIDIDVIDVQDEPIPAKRA